MKILFDILLIGIMLATMGMMFWGVNRLADPTDQTSEKDGNALKNEFGCGEETISPKNIFGAFFLKRLPIRSKNDQNMISNGPSSRKL